MLCSMSSYSIFEPRTRRNRSVPPARPRSCTYSRTRVEKKRSREASNRMPERCSMSTRISLSSACLRFEVIAAMAILIGTGHETVAPTGLGTLRRSAGRGAHRHRRGCRRRLPFRLAVVAISVAVARAELGEGFVQLVGELDHVADGAYGLTRALR